MTAVNFHNQAASEIKEIYHWYASRDAKAALVLNDAIEEATQRIANDPLSHEVETKGFHWVRVRKFPYRLIYEIVDERRVLILAVAHTSRKPRYWKDRN
ncbi:MAG: type II toxin-antitoxin system RelE/ParE family toxin [Planctomycetaceae bacterium]|jgi:toxin ParE1/3/4|nr:type II toxin-antitoxin system RelE/ParE family toxin [Planctomycetaceae bacterium]MDG2390510.1 type II toxin-antitoxin system RelE/ParE family toxin [Planctomycetaceae bacterium]